MDSRPRERLVLGGLGSFHLGRQSRGEAPGSCTVKDRERRLAKSFPFPLLCDSKLFSNIRTKQRAEDNQDNQAEARKEWDRGIILWNVGFTMVAIELEALVKRRDTKTFALKRSSGRPPYMIKRVLCLYDLYLCAFLCACIFMWLFVCIQYTHIYFYSLVELYGWAVWSVGLGYLYTDSHQ